MPRVHLIEMSEPLPETEERCLSIGSRQMATSEYEVLRNVIHALHPLANGCHRSYQILPEPYPENCLIWQSPSWLHSWHFNLMLTASIQLLRLLLVRSATTPRERADDNSGPITSSSGTKMQPPIFCLEMALNARPWRVVLENRTLLLFFHLSRSSKCFSRTFHNREDFFSVAAFVCCAHCRSSLKLFPPEIFE